MNPISKLISKIKNLDNGPYIELNREKALVKLGELRFNFSSPSLTKITEGYEPLDTKGINPVSSLPYIHSCGIRVHFENSVI
jgi:hypothetical protein